MIELRPYADADAGAVVDIWFRASQVAHSFLPDAFFDREREEIADRWLPAAETFVAERGGRIVGFLSLVGNEVGAIFVDPDLHGSGVGRALMDEAVRRRGSLELDVFERNELGRGFYDHYGFRQIGGGRHDATGEMQLRLRLG